MTDENNGTKNGSDAAIGASSVGKADPKDPIPSKPATEADLEQVEKRMSGFEHSTLRWTRASFIIVLATAVFICLQWLEMRSGGKDTHDLAVAAGKQADRMQDFADQMNRQADETRDLAAAAGKQADASKAIANQAEAANDQSERLFKLRNRPWVGVEDDVVFDEKGIKWVGAQGEAIVRQQAAKGTLPIRILYHLKNSGDGPALSTQLVIQPFTWSPSPTDMDDEPRIRAGIEKSCQIAEERVAKQNGDLILPTGEHTVPYTFGQWDSTKYLFTPGCIVYRDVDGRLHHTRICYGVAMFLSPKPVGLESCQDQSAD
jgi:hypothetical protein